MSKQTNKIYTGHIKTMGIIVSKNDSVYLPIGIAIECRRSIVYKIKRKLIKKTQIKIKKGSS